MNHCAECNTELKHLFGQTWYCPNDCDRKSKSTSISIVENTDDEGTITVYYKFHSYSKEILSCLKRGETPDSSKGYWAFLTEDRFSDGNLFIISKKDIVSTDTGIVRIKAGSKIFGTDWKS